MMKISPAVPALLPSLFFDHETVGYTRLFQVWQQMILFFFPFFSSKSCALTCRHNSHLVTLSLNVSLFSCQITTIFVDLKVSFVCKWHWIRHPYPLCDWNNRNKRMRESWWLARFQWIMGVFYYSSAAAEPCQMCNPRIRCCAFQTRQSSIVSHVLQAVGK